MAMALGIGPVLTSCGGSSSNSDSSSPISVSATAAATKVDGGNSITIVATVANDKRSAGVNWSLSGSGTLSQMAATSVTYTAPAPAASALTATITATSVTDTSKSSTITITVPAKVSITTPSLTAGEVGSAYSAQLNAAGGIPPYAWTLTSGTLPSCMALSSSGTLTNTGGLIASCAGTSNLTFQVTDSGKPAPLTATTTLALTVNAAPAIVFSGSMPAFGVRGTAYTGNATATGGAGTLAYSLAYGVMPPGLTVNPTNGAVTGSPTSSGTYSFDVRAMDGYGDVQTNSYQIRVLDPLAINSSNLTSTGTTNHAYGGTIRASGGVGNYAWQVTGLPSNGLSTTAFADMLTVSGTPTSPATVNFTVKLTDSPTNLTLSQSFTITISNPTPVMLPAPNPASLPTAALNQAYSGTIIATGGVAPYSWSVNGAPVPDTGLALSNGLIATATGSNTLAVTGTPITTSTVALENVMVTDSQGTNATQSYTISVSNAGQVVSGHVGLSTYCGAGSQPPLPSITVTLNTTPVMHATSDSSGNFTFSNVPPGTYTLTPSTAGPPNEPNAIFNPANQQVTVTTSAVSGIVFSTTLGFTISGTVAYRGAVTGRTYLNLLGACGGGIGTSLSNAALTGGGAFTLHGVPPGTYALTAWMDPSTLANGAPNDADPRATVQGLTVSPSNLTGVTIMMADPTVAVQTAGPVLKGLNPTNAGVVISYGEGSVTDQTTGMEAFSSYTVQWSTNSGFTGTPSGATFKATGTTYSVWMAINGNNGMTGSLTSGTAYYFRVRGTNAGGNSSWVYWGGAGNTCSSSSCAIAVTIGEPSGSSYATVTGTVNITAEMAPLVTGPLYVAYYDPEAGTSYGYVVTNPVIGDNGYSIPVLKSATAEYVPYAVLDQNKDGLIDANDVTNFIDNPPPVIINNSQSGLIELSYVYDQPRVQTHFIQLATSTGTSTQSFSSYDLKFVINGGNKLPVAAQLTGGPNVLAPVDIGSLCLGCGGQRFAYEIYFGNAAPKLGDFYTFQTTFSDGSVQMDYGQVMGFGGSGVVTGPANVANGLAPIGNVPGETQPLFTWTYPVTSVPGQIAWQFWICCSGNGTIWRIPGYSSNATGFSSTQIPGTLIWGNDPTDSANKPTPSVLTSGTGYVWQIMGQDDWGNTAAAQTQFIP